MSVYIYKGEMTRQRVVTEKMEGNERLLSEFVS